MTRDQFFESVFHLLGVEPEYLWTAYPNYAVFRHPGSQKWFAILMDLTPDKLGLPGSERVDALVLRCGPALTGSLLLQDGFYPAYHMNKGNWITTFLSGPVSEEELHDLLCLCYDAVAPKRKPRPAPSQS